MTWLNNPTNNEFQIKNKLNIDITKLYWDGSAYGALFWGNGDANLGGVSGSSYHMTALRFNKKSIICGNDFVSTEKTSSLTYNGTGLLGQLRSWSTAGSQFDFIINTNTFDIQNYIYEIKVNFNWKGFNANISDNEIFKNRQSGASSARSSGMSCLLFNDISQTGSTFTYSNNFAGGLGQSDTSLQQICTAQPYRQNDASNPRFQSLRCFGRGVGSSSLSFQNPSAGGVTPIRRSSSNAKSDSFYWFPNFFSFNNLNTNGNIAPNSISVDAARVSNNYSSNMIDPYNHGYFDILISKEYCSKYSVWFGSGPGTTSPFYCTVNTVANENVINSFWLSSNYPGPSSTGYFYFPYLSFVIFSNNAWGNTNGTKNPFMYSSEWQIPNDAISNVEILITRIPRINLNF
jgi:hypothetical protein